MLLYRSNDEVQIMEDRTMKFYWKCGLITAVRSGTKSDCDYPSLVAELYHNYLKRHKE